MFAPPTRALHLLSPLITIGVWLFCGAIPVSAQDPDSKAFRKELSELETKYEQDRLEKSEAAFQAYLNDLRALEATYRSLSRKEDADRVAQEIKSLESQRAAEKSKKKPDGKRQETPPATPSPEATGGFVAELSVAEMSGGVAYHSATKTLTGWGPKGAQAKIRFAKVPPGDYELWLEYARWENGRLQVQIGAQTERLRLNDTKSPETFDVEPVAVHSHAEPGDITVVLSVPNRRPREFCRIRRVELRRLFKDFFSR